VRWWSLTVFAAGCGSYWDIREGQGLPAECPSLLNYYVDADGDGWGDPDSDVLALCGEDLGDPNDASDDYSASNGKDCDDSDPQIGSSIGACPEVIADATAGLVRGGFEYLVVVPPSPPITDSSAGTACVRWSGETLEGVEEGHRGLAILDDPAEFVDLTSQLLDSAGDAIFVGVRWDESAASWVWLDGQAIGGTIAFCGNQPPSLDDVRPDVVLDLASPSDRATLIAQTRLALLREQQGWCLGLPALSEGPTQLREAHFLCERPSPDPADYVDVPSNDEG
jgi:hypothetical protein